MFKRLVVGYDFSDPADDALAWAVELARALGAQVAVVHVVEADSDDDPGIATARANLATVADDAGPEVASHVIRGHRVSEALVRFADVTDADVLVVATRGLGGVARMLMGSVADSVVRHATCPVITIRHED